MSTQVRRPVRRRLGRLEREAILGVMSREIINFGSYWKATTFSSTVEPTIYLLAFGFGFGSLVSEVAGYDYVEFVGTGTVATAVLFSSAFPAMFGTFVKHRFQRTYDAILATPVDTEELVTAEALWIACRAGTYGCAPLPRGADLRARPPLGDAARARRRVPDGLRLRLLRHHRGRDRRVDRELQLHRLGRPHAAVPRGRDVLPDRPAARLGRRAGQPQPLYHCVELVRHCAFGFEGLTDLWHVAALAVFAVALWRLAINRMTKRLVE
jgi:lipooligosaccharide transport system permease protein